MWHLLKIEGVHHFPVSVMLCLGPLDRSSGILEPVNDVVDVQRLLPLPGLEPVEDADILLHLEARWMIVLSKPGLQFGDLVFWIKANPHPRLVLVIHTCWRFYLKFSLQININGLEEFEWFGKSRMLPLLGLLSDPKSWEITFSNVRL